MGSTNYLNSNRLYNLDYLRGLAASGIMIFHYSTWIFGDLSSDAFLGRVGIYGVSIFYVLSGLTLFTVYNTKMNFDKVGLSDFFIKRIFRIFPLLWLVIISTLLLNKQVPDYLILTLNLTGLFGFFQWDKYIGVGVWSIGNELVFYVFFSIFIFLSKSHFRLFLLFSVLILFTYLFFALSILDPSRNLSDQWNNYVNPLNQLFLFLSGFLIGLFFSHSKLSNVYCLLLIGLSFLVFIFYPIVGDTIHLVVGVNRILFTVVCIALCFSFYKLRFKLPNFLHKPLAMLGEASYSVYLLHPIVFRITGFGSTMLKGHLSSMYGIVRMSLALFITLSLSYIIYWKFEKFFMNKGKMVAAWACKTKFNIF